MISVVTSHLLWAASASAQWTVTSREKLPSSPGADFTRIAMEGPAGQVEVLALSVSPKTHTIAVVDDPEGDLRVATAGAGVRAIAVVNGGYFHPDRTPLGLVVAQGKVLHGLEKAKLLSGLVVAEGTRVSLLRAAEFKNSPKQQAVLQAGPFLVDRGLPVPGLNAVKGASRTVVFTADGGAMFGLVVCRSATLADTAAMLATKDLLPHHTLSRALNLDGGTSTGLWISQPEGAFSIREWKNVRNYLAIVPR